MQQIGLLRRKRLKAALKEDSEDWYNFMLVNSVVANAEDITLRHYLEVMNSASEYIGRLHRPFARMRTLVVRWGIDFQSAARQSLLTLRSRVFWRFISRLCRVLEIGTKLSDFLKVESLNFFTTKFRELERGKDRFRLLSDAYAALISSMLYVSIALILSSGLFGFGEPAQILFALMIAMVAMPLFILFLSRRTLPSYSLIIKGSHVVNRYRLITNVLIFSPALLIILVFFGLSQQIGYLTIIVLGAIAYFLAFRLRRLVKYVKSIDEELPTFLKALADASASGGSISSGVNTVAVARWGLLMKPLLKLRNRLMYSIDFNMAWRMFINELKSELGRIHLGIFALGASTGLSPSSYINNILDSIEYNMQLRKIRTDAAGYAKGLLVPLQATVTAVIGMIVGLIDVFARISRLAAETSSMAPLPFFTRPLAATGFLFQAFVFAFSALLLIMNTLLIGTMESGSPEPFLRMFSYLSLATGGAGLAMNFATGALTGLWGVQLS